MKRKWTNIVPLVRLHASLKSVARVPLLMSIKSRSEQYVDIHVHCYIFGDCFKSSHPCPPSPKQKRMVYCFYIACYHRSCIHNLISLLKRPYLSMYLLHRNLKSCRKVVFLHVQPILHLDMPSCLQYLHSLFAF